MPDPDPRRPSPRLALSLTQSRVLVACACAAGITLSVVFAQQARRAEAARIAESFRGLTHYQMAANSERMRLIEELLAGLRRAVTYQNELTRDEFDGICNEIFARYEGFQSLQWLQVVPHAWRTWIEEQLSVDYGFPITFKWLTPANTFQPAGERKEYRVIRYAMPVESNAIVLGYDVSRAATAAYQDRAAASASLAVTAPFRLAQTSRDDEELGINFIMPVYGPGDDEPELRGFVQGVFRASGIFAPSVLPEYSGHATYRYLDRTDDPTRSTLLYSTAAEETVGPAGSPDPAPDNQPASPLAVQQVINIGGREWLFVAEARPDWIASLRTHQPELILGGGLCMTGLAALVLLGFFRRARWVDQLVVERTHDLLTQRGELQAILDHSPNAIWIKDLEGRYVLANRVLEQIYGEPLANVIGRTDEVFYPPEVAEEMRAADRRALQAASHILIEGEYDIRGERRHYYTVKFPVRRESGEIFGVGGIATDVTTFKRVEHQLAETQKLESLGVLAGGIAHDFNNLLTGMLGNASLIAHQLPAEDEIGQSAREIETAAKRAAELCRQMLAYSGRGRFVIERLDLAAAVRELVPLLRSSMGACTDLRLRLDPGLPAVDVDPSQFRQVIMNLVINACEALPAQGGWVEVTNALRRLDRRQLRQAIGHPDLPAGHYLSFQVRDNGSGIEPGNLRRIFEPFFTTKFTGRGLGLSAVLGIVRSHRGALRVDSVPGQGTTFELFLPVPEGATAGPPARSALAAPLPGSLHGLRVYLVEDEPAVYQLVLRILARAGAHVTAYDTGARAANEFTAGEHDLAIIDLTLPGLGGREVLARLRDRQPEIPVLVISGYSEQEADDQFYAVRPDGFLQKPFSAAELMEAIERIRRG